MYMRRKLRNDVSNIPPFYSGTTFEKHLGSDGREEYSYRGLLPIENSTSADEIISSYPNEHSENSDVTEDFSNSDEKTEKNNELNIETLEKNDNSFSEFFSHFGNDDLLIIALIILLASEKGESREVILLLVFLLVAGK